MCVYVCVRVCVCVCVCVLAVGNSVHLVQLVDMVLGYICLIRPPLSADIATHHSGCYVHISLHTNTQHSSLTYSVTHSLTHLLTHSLTHSHTHPLTQTHRLFILSVVQMEEGPCCVVEGIYPIRGHFSAHTQGQLSSTNTPEVT